MIGSIKYDFYIMLYLIELCVFGDFFCSRIFFYVFYKVYIFYYLVYNFEYKCEFFSCLYLYKFMFFVSIVFVSCVCFLCILYYIIFKR